MSDRLQDLLVLPAGLARLLVQVALGRAVRLEQRLDEAEQRRLLLVVGVELRASAISSMPSPASRPVRWSVESAYCSLVLRDRERDPLLGRVGERAVAELRAEAAYERSTGGELARTPMKFGSWPPPASAPFRSGRVPGGRLLVMDLNLLSFVFISALLSRTTYVR